MSGVAEVSGSLLLASNNFYREFPDDPVPTAAAKALPQMGGAGWARDLREAMSLGNDKSQALQEKVQAFAAGTTRDAQMAAVDGLITEWARSSGKLVETLRFHSLYFDAATHQWDIATPDTPIDPRHLPGTEGTLSVDMPDVGTLWTDPATGQQRPLTEEDRTALYQKLNALEVFNGTRFVTFDRNVRPDSSEGSGGTPIGGGSGSGGGGSGAEADLTYRVSARLSTTQLELLAQSYEQLRESVYAALVTQTRLRPYLDSVELVVDEKGVRFDTSALLSMLEAKKGASERDAIIDLVELNRYQGKLLDAVGVDSLGLLSGWVQALPADSPVRSELQGLRVFLSSVNAGTQLDDIYLGGASSDHFAGGNGDDRLHGGAGDDVLQGEGGDDRLSGGVGNDNLWGGADNDTLLGEDGNDGLYGEAGDDVLDGGAGNDYMDGGAGANTYRFGRGDGQDTIAYKSGGSDGKLGTLQFKDGVQASDIVLRQVYDNQLGSKALEVSIAGTGDKVTINGFFYNSDPANPLNSVQRFEFADGTTWDLAAITAKLFAGTASADDFTGTSGDDTMHGGAGNDELRGGAGNDTLLGEDGNDGLYGEAGDDVLDGGAGNDYMDGGAGANTYRFGRGDGQDTIAYKSGGSDGKLGTLQFKDGVQASDIVLRQVYDNQLGSKALEVSIAGTGDKVTINGFFYNSDPANPLNSVQRFEFADGTTWDLAAISAKLFTGGDGNDSIVGTSRSDTIRGEAGDDSLYGGEGNDVILGGSGNDWISGEAGDDVIEGGAGNDNMTGGRHGAYDGVGNDTYVVGRGDGNDIIYDNDGTPGNTDVLQFQGDVQADQLWFRRVGQSLEVSVIGSGDKVSVLDWFASANYQLEQIKSSDGKTLSSANVNALVEAMAAFAPPAAGQTTLPPDYRSSLSNVIATNWT
ncbi:calcium-binding protein [Paracidovorax avenae]|uniref:calcium-binding protein n=1 Tax=Paracidovorax avenae TaxID=80867 RepID=UPI001F20D2A3|nr:calcium-binding protein [Paracidovorax avenae]